ncbi:uncharacterized protein LOC144705773 [Wolffia australiana]
MVDLFLSKPSDVGGEGDSAEERILLLRNLESVIWRVITSSGRYESRLWFCNTISRVRDVDHTEQQKLFLGILESAPSKREVAAQILRMIFDKKPAKAGAFLARKCYMLEKFFQGHPKRILKWFDHFACTADYGHRKGARAMSQFAFTNRDICWEDLEWKGRHGQSPAVVATKPHYFHDLNILKTVENFLEHVPEFWSSDELAESVKDGQILHIEPQFFLDQFIRLMYEDNVEDVWAMIEDFIIEEQFSSLCQRILILLGEHELHDFVTSLCKLQRTRWACENFGYPSAWLESLLSASDFEDITLNDLILVNAVINEGRQIIRLLGEEEHELESRKIEELLKNETLYSSESHWSLLRRCSRVDLLMTIKWLGLESWIILYNLSKETKQCEYFESVFIKNGINFKKSEEHSLIGSGEVSDRSLSDSDDLDYRRKSRKRKWRKKQVGRKSDVDEVFDFRVSDGDLFAGRGIWLLSTDGFSSPWNMKDLPEHLSRHCFSMWMKWARSD